MGRTTSVYTITHVAKMLGENLELLEEIASNDDNLDYGDIVTIWTGDDETMTSFTDDGIDRSYDSIWCFEGLKVGGVSG